MNNLMLLGNTLINVISAYLGGAYKALPEAVDCGELLKFAKKHGVEVLASYALSELYPQMPQTDKKLCREIIFRGVSLDDVQAAETKRICDGFEEAQIAYMLLKGSVIKSLYPSGECRSMSDVDFLLDRENRIAAKDILVSLGYELTSDDGDNAELRKPPSMNIELHCVLMNSDVPLYHAYFGEGLRRTVPDGGVKKKYNDEDFYVFMAAHAAKHYFLGGTGIRTVIDFWLFKKNKTLDMDYVLAELETLHLTEFVSVLDSLAAVWFEGKEPSELDKSVAEYVLASGTHGSLKNVNALALKSGGDGNKKKYFLRRLFPEYKQMVRNYPLLKRAKMLLPLFWLIRLIKAPFIGNSYGMNEVKGALKTEGGVLSALSIDGNPRKYEGEAKND